MNAHSTLVPFADYAPPYAREREYSRTVEKRLAKALFFLRVECNRRDHAGEDCSHIRRFIAECEQ